MVKKAVVLLWCQLNRFPMGVVFEYFQSWRASRNITQRHINISTDLYSSHYFITLLLLTSFIYHNYICTKTNAFAQE
jgi:hypothetical protein